MIPPPEHLRFEPLKVCAARLLALPVFKEVLPGSVAEQVLLRFCSTVAVVVKPGQPKESLDAYLNARLATVRTYVSALTEPEQREGTPLLQALQNAVANVTCLACASAAGGHQCDGRDHRRDAAQITNSGLCLRLIHEIHNDIVGRLENTVQSWTWPDSPSTVALLTHRWSTRWSGPPQTLRPTADPKIAGSTHFLDERSPEKRLAEMRLSLTVDHLDWPSLLTVSWLFAHEFVCHVLQLPQDSGTPREPCRPGCPFFEGWMDEVAAQLVHAYLWCGWLGDTGSSFVRSHGLAMVEAMERHRLWRYDAIQSVLAPQWKLGRDAARAVRQVFVETAPAAKHEDAQRRRLALAELVGLSFRIQVAARSTSHLDDLVGACLVASARAASADPSRRGRILECLTRPIGDICNWINELRKV
jgi:hypothetical protein